MMNGILYVDLTEGSSRAVEKPELFIRYLGGSGVGSKLLLEGTKQGIDPFSPDAPIILSAGYLSTVFPCMVKTVAMFKSPLSGNLGESHAGGHLATALTFAGYGAMVIKGASEYPVIIRVADDTVKVERASSLWSLSPLKVERALKSFKLVGMQSVASIGRAGENYVYYSNVIVDRFHHFGRLGLGAIFGSKRLKAISITGTQGINLDDPLAVKDEYEKLHQKVVTSGEMAKYHDLGTSSNVLELNELGALPTQNFRESRYKDAEGISGETMAESLLKKKISCPGCPIACIHIAGLRSSFAPEHELGKEEIFKEEELVPYNYEPMYALGSNLLVNDPRDLLRLIHRCESLGLDAMTTGVVLAWITDAFHEGRITITDTLGVKPEWGDTEAYLKIMDELVEMKNPFYGKLAQGLSATVKKYGGREYAMMTGNSGIPGYLTGYGAMVGPLVGARHSHLSNSGYSLDQKTVGQSLDPDQIADYLVEQEDWLYVLYSLGTCYFARRIYSKEVVCEALKTVGIEATPEELMKRGKEIFHNLYRFKVREGFDISKEKLPKRLFETLTLHGRPDPIVAERIKASYVKRREREGLQMRSEEGVLKELLFPEGPPKDLSE